MLASSDQSHDGSVKTPPMGQGRVLLMQSAPGGQQGGGGGTQTSGQGPPSVGQGAQGGSCARVVCAEVVNISAATKIIINRGSKRVRFMKVLHHRHLSFDTMVIALMTMRSRDWFPDTLATYLSE